MSSYRRRLLLANQSEENLHLYGNSVQDGTPTPEAPIDIISLENPIIKVTSNNLFNKSTVEQVLAYFNGSKWTYNNGSTSIKFPCEPNKTYAISGNNPSNKIFRVGYIIVDDIPIGDKTIDLYNPLFYTSFNQPAIITTGDNAKFLVIQVGSSTWDMNIEKLQIQEGAVATKYESYEEELITIDKTIPFGKNWVTDDVYNINNWIRVGNGYGYYLNLPTGDYTASVEKKDNSSQFFYLQISTNDWTDFVTKHILLNASNNRVTFTVGENTKCRFYTTNSAFTNYIDSIQIEKGKYYTGYEPYVAPITSMRGVGNYKDRIYTKDGKVWFEQRSWLYKTSLGQKVYQNKITSLGLQFYTDNNIVDEKHRSLGRTALLEENNPGLSTHFIYNEKAYSAWGLSDTTAMIGARLWFLSDNFANQDAAQLWFNENQIEVIYPLLNPIVTQITGVLAEKILSIDKSKNITIYSDNGVYGNSEIIEE